MPRHRRDTTVCKENGKYEIFLSMNDPAATQTARRLLAQMREGTLATLTSDGAPFASLVTFALDEAGQPLLLLSTLARHTQNLLVDARASLLVVEASENDADRKSTRLNSRH